VIYSHQRTLPEFREEMAYIDAYATGDVPEYQVHPIGDKYAIVLTGTPNEIVGWSNNLDNAVKIAQALNEAEGL
jgi:hypothetical protein